MATILPPKPKRLKRAVQEWAKKQQCVDLQTEEIPNIVVRLCASQTGNQLGGELQVPGSTTLEQLNQLVNKLLGSEGDKVPYTFSLLSDSSDLSSSVVDITTNIWSNILQPGIKTIEDVLTIVYTPQAVFRVRAVSRCSTAISGHSESILATHFSPASSSRMVSGSGDGTARIWDCETETPLQILKGHKSWVLCVSWSPDGELIATGGMDNYIRLWEPKTGKALGDAMKGHTKWITSLAWEPFHLQNRGSPRLATASKDMTIRIWNGMLRRVEMTLSGHSAAVTCVKWGGNGHLFSASQDKTIKIWDSKTGAIFQSLTSHAHWINHLALSTDFVLRTGYFDYTRQVPATDDEKRTKAKLRYEKVAIEAGNTVERLVTASEDNTMYLWEPEKSSNPVARMVGHQKGVNFVAFSPDGRIIASTSFDNSVKLWNSMNGKYIATLRGHVGPVYQCAFSADSRLLVSSSKDSTLKIWDVRTGKIHTDLPGHQDEVFAVDWSPDGQRVVSGGKDRVVRLWKY